MNRAQWYTLLSSDYTVAEEIDRILKLDIIPDDQVDEFFHLLGGLVQCCANVASRIDSQRRLPGDGTEATAG